MSTKLIVVLGATGIQGGSVVDIFLQDPNWRVRGVTRNASSASAKKLRSRGVEVVSANFEDVASLAAAFQGANAIFAVTDFWAPLADEANRSKLRPGQSMPEWAGEYEFLQGRNIFDAAAQAQADHQGLERIVFSSLSHASQWSKGKYTHVYHFDSKGNTVEYVKEKHPALWAKTSLIQVGFYLSNFIHFPFFKPQKGDDGVYNFTVKLPSDVKLPMIATEEDTGPFVKALVTSPRTNLNLVAYREWMSLEELAQTWSRTLGVPARNVTIPFDKDWEIVEDELKEELDETMRYMTEFGYEGRDDPSVVHPRDLGVDVQLAGTVEEWIKKQDWSSVL